MYNRRHIVEHLRSSDPQLTPIFKYIRREAITPSRTPFMDLVEAIINQQLSEKAGSTIFTRLCSAFPHTSLTPKKLLDVPDQQVRDLGVSWSKVSYLKSLSRAVVTKALIFEDLKMQKDADVITNLTKIKGIGAWTAEMFLMFSLGREDVFSYGDLGLRRGIQLLYKLKKEPSLKQMEKLSGRWKPYRTYVALALWNFKDG